MGRVVSYRISDLPGMNISKEQEVTKAARGKSLSNPKEIILSDGTRYFINEIPESLKKGNKGESGQDHLIDNDVNILYLKNFVNAHTTALDVVATELEDIGQPSLAEVRRAMILKKGYDGFWYVMKAGGGSLSDNAYSSMVQMDVEGKNGEDEMKTILVKFSKDFEKVRITPKEVRELKSKILTLSESKPIRKDEVESLMDFLVVSRLTGKVRTDKGYVPYDEKFEQRIKEKIISLGDEKTYNDHINFRIKQFQGTIDWIGDKKCIYMTGEGLMDEAECEKRTKEELEKNKRQIQFWQNLQHELIHDKKMVAEDGAAITDSGIMTFEDFKRELPVLHNVKWGDKKDDETDVEYIAKYNPYSGTVMYFKHGRRNSEKMSLADAYNHYKYFAEKGQKFEDGGDMTSTNTQSEDVAKEIIRQIGGFGKLRAMTGAYNFVVIGNGVSFRIKNPRANYIKIVLNPMDLYDVEIGRIRGLQYKLITSASGLYNDQLKPFIEQNTGMYLSLFEDGGDIDMDDEKTDEEEQFTRGGGVKPYPLMHVGPVVVSEDKYARWHPPHEVYQYANKLWAKAKRQQRIDWLKKYVFDFVDRNFQPGTPGSAIPELKWSQLEWTWKRDIATGLHNENFGITHVPKKVFEEGGDVGVAGPVSSEQSNYPFVVEVMYRDGANYKNFYTFGITKEQADELKSSIGDTINSTELGISEQEWYDKYLPGEYDPEFDHNLLEVEQVRERKDDDVLSNIWHK